MKKFLSLLICICLLIVFVIPSFAITPYGSLTEDSSQAKILIEAMLNDIAFDVFGRWYCYRSGEYEYTLYFNIEEDSSSVRYRYYAITQGYNSTWYLERTEVNHTPEIDGNTYTYVGNFTFSLGSQLYRQFQLQHIVKYCVIFITLLLGFFVFRVKRRVVL